VVHEETFLSVHASLPTKHIRTKEEEEEEEKERKKFVCLSVKEILIKKLHSWFEMF